MNDGGLPEKEYFIGIFKKSSQSKRNEKKITFQHLFTRNECLVSGKQGKLKQEHLLDHEHQATTFLILTSSKNSLYYYRRLASGQ